MRILKGILLGAVLVSLIACGVGTRLLHKECGPEEKTAAPLYPNRSSVPSEKVQWGAYLAGVLARENHDYEKAVYYFEQAAAVDKGNDMLKTDIYLLKVLQGDLTNLESLAEAMTQTGRPELLSEYVVAALKAHDGQYEKALEAVSDKKEYGLDFVLQPVVEAWLYAGLQKPQKAFDALEGLKKSKELQEFYQMHRGMLAVYLKDDEAADKAFRHFEKRHPPLVLLEIMRQFYIPRGLWTPDFPLAIQYKKAQENPLSAELLRLLSGMTIQSPTDGLSEAFQGVSNSLGDDKRVREPALILTGLAQYLNEDNVMAQIWGAELFESVGAYRKANVLYDRIKVPSDTIVFKKALNDVQMKAYERALPLLEELMMRNPNEALLSRTLGGAYMQQGRYQKAVQAYTQAIRLMPLGDVEGLARCYMGRGLAYEALGASSEAESDFVNALKLKPEDALLLNEVGYRWLVQKKNIPQAFEYVLKAHQISPEDPHIMDSLALGYLLKKEYQKALDLMERALEKMPYSAVLYERSGDIYRAMGRLREADYQYQKALDLGSDLTSEMRFQLQKKREAIK